VGVTNYCNLDTETPRLETAASGRHKAQPRAAIARLGAEQDGVLRDHRRQPDGSLRDTVVFSIPDTGRPAVRSGPCHRPARGGS
jgi:RimJ/RimL family protein N-acetyltransferase